MANKVTKKGAKWFVCAVAQNVDLTEAMYRQLPWVEVSNVGTDGDFGPNSSFQTYNTLAERISNKQKGSADAGEPTLEYADVYDDDGQAILKTFGDPNNLDNMAICYQKNNAPLTTMTKTVHYSRGVVSGPVNLGGGTDDFERRRVNIGLNQVPVEQVPTTGAVPTNVAVPTITGTAQEGETLTASDGTWDSLDPGVSYSYQWKADAADIADATESTYVLTGSEVGAVITVQVVATNAFGDSTGAVSAATATVVAA